MFNTNSIAVNTEVKSFQLKETILLLLGSVALQFGIHLIPSPSAVPLGAILLPIFIAPLIACIFFRLHTALIAGILAPSINYLITGSPAPELLLLLTAELVVFTLLLPLFLHFGKIKMIAALAGIIIAKIFSSSILPLISSVPAVDLVQSLITALPGIIVLSLLNILLLRHKENV
jgi:hypothetical protein